MTALTLHLLTNKDDRAALATIASNAGVTFAENVDFEKLVREHVATAAAAAAADTTNFSIDSATEFQSLYIANFIKGFYSIRGTWEGR